MVEADLVEFHFKAQEPEDDEPVGGGKSRNSEILHYQQMRYIQRKILEN